MSSSSLLRVLLVVLTHNLLSAQSAGSRDTQFVTVAGTDAVPSALGPIPGGGVYVGGSFTNYGGTGRAGLVRLTATGSVDPSLSLATPRLITPPVVFNGQVLVAGSTNAGNISAILALPDRRPVIAGKFSHLGDTPVPGLAILNLDGSVAAAPADTAGIEPAALLAGPGDTFYASGKGTVDGTRLAVLRFRSDGSRDPAFTPPTLAALSLAGGNPFRLMHGPGDTLYAVIAGVGTGGASYELTRFTASGGLDDRFADGGRAVIPNPTFGGMASSPGGQVAFTGIATYRGQTLDRKVNRLNLDGSLDGTFNASIDPGAGARVIAVQADGKVLFTSGSRPVNRLNADGSVDVAYANPVQSPTPLLLLSLTWFAPAPDGSLFAAGITFGENFAVLNGAFRILGDPAAAPTIVAGPVSQEVTEGARARFEVTPEGAPPFTYVWRHRGEVIPGAKDRQLVVDPVTPDDIGEYSVVVSNALGSAPAATATLDVLPALPGAVWRETDPGSGTDAPVTTLAFDAQGRLLAGGGFTRFHGTNRVRLARLIEDGRGVDPTFDTSGLAGVSFPTQVLPLSSGRVLLAGSILADYGGRGHAGVIVLGDDGRLDTAFNPDGVSGDPSNRFSETADGRLLVASPTWNGVPLAGGYARLSASGERDVLFVPQAPLTGGGGVIIPAPADGALVSGRTNLNERGHGVIHLTANGAQEPAFRRGPLPGLTGSGVTDIVRLEDGRILVAGTFVRTDVLPQRNLGVIRLLPDGSPDPAFNPVPSLSAIDGTTVSRIVPQADGRLLVLGNFTRIGGHPRPGIARLWPNGTVDPDFNPPAPAHPGHPGAFATVAVSPGNVIMVGGDFHALGGVARTNVARLVGGPLQALPAPPQIAAVTARLTPTAGSTVTLSVVASGTGPFQYQWRRNLQTGSTLFQDIEGATGPTLELAALRVEHSGLFQVHVVNPGGATASGFIPVLVQPDPKVPGTIDRSFAGVPSTVTTPAPGGMLFAALADRVIRLFEDGTPDTNHLSPSNLLIPDPHTDNRITAILRQSDGKLLVVGRLSTRTGPCNVEGATCFAPQRGIVRLLPDGTYDPDFEQDNRFAGDAQNLPLAVAVQSDDRILVAGNFDNFAGGTCTGLIRLMPDGLPDPSFVLAPGLRMLLANPLRDIPGQVRSMALRGDDRIYVGGAFTHAHGAVRHGVARLLADGSLDTGFVPPTDSASATGTAGRMTFHALGPVTPDGGILVFGTFQPVANGPVYAALRLRADGSVDETFRVTTDFQINTGVLQSDGRLLISGQFTRVNGQPRSFLTRLHADGTLDPSFQHPGTSAGVGAPLTILADGTLLAGGTRYFLDGTAGPDRPEIGFVWTPSGLQLTWPAGHRLQRSPGLLPPAWHDLEGSSPLTVTPSGSSAFFRLVPSP